MLHLLVVTFFYVSLLCTEAVRLDELEELGLDIFDGHEHRGLPKDHQSKGRSELSLLSTANETSSQMQKLSDAVKAGNLEEVNKLEAAAKEMVEKTIEAAEVTTTSPVESEAPAPAPLPMEVTTTEPEESPAALKASEDALKRDMEVSEGAEDSTTKGPNADETQVVAPAEGRPSAEATVAPKHRFFEEARASHGAIDHALEGLSATAAQEQQMATDVWGKLGDYHKSISAMKGPLKQLSEQAAQLTKHFKAYVKEDEVTRLEPLEGVKNIFKKAAASKPEIEQSERGDHTNTKAIGGKDEDDMGLSRLFDEGSDHTTTDGDMGLSRLFDEGIDHTTTDGDLGLSRLFDEGSPATTTDGDLGLSRLFDEGSPPTTTDGDLGLSRLFDEGSPPTTTDSPPTTTDDGDLMGLSRLFDEGSPSTTIVSDLGLRGSPPTTTDSASKSETTRPEPDDLALASEDSCDDKQKGLLRNFCTKSSTSPFCAKARRLCGDGYYKES